MSTSTQRRVVITGLGLISPLGDTPETLWDALVAGRSGVGKITSLPEGSLPVDFAGEAHCFTGDAENFGPLEKELKKTIKKAQKVMCRDIQMGVAAAMRAMFHSGLIPGPKYLPERAGCLFGADYMMTVPDEFSAGIAAAKGADGNFDFEKWIPDATPRLYPLWLLKYLPNMPAAHVSIFNDLRGPNNSITHREAAGNLAITEGARTIARGHADVMITGSTGTRIQMVKAIHAVQTEELATNADPTAASRPFDKNRNGMVLGEGAGSLTLEEVEHAKARGATIYGEIIACSSSTVMARDGVADRGLALSHVIRNLLKEANIAPDKIGHIHAHGLGSQSCDKAEAAAINAVLGDAAKKVPVVAAKSYFGNLGAGSGIVELIGSISALRAGHLFKTLNYTTPDPECAINVTRSNDVPAGETFINLNVTPQGQASGVMVKAWRE